jgi:hypothetical protein
MNVAMKVPRAQFGRTLAFYRDTSLSPCERRPAPRSCRGQPQRARRPEPDHPVAGPGPPLHASSGSNCSPTSNGRRHTSPSTVSMPRTSRTAPSRRARACITSPGASRTSFTVPTARHDPGTIRRAAQGDKRVSGDGGGGIPSDTRCRRRTRLISTRVALAPEVIAVHEQFGRTLATPRRAMSTDGRERV